MLAYSQPHAYQVIFSTAATQPVRSQTVLVAGLLYNFSLFPELQEVSVGLLTRYLWIKALHYGKAGTYPNLFSIICELSVGYILHHYP